MSVDLKTASAVILPAEKQSFDPSKIPQAVKNAGFSPGEIEVTAKGTLGREDDMLRLNLRGQPQQLVLAGGKKRNELGGQEDLIGRLIRVTGKLHPPHADKPPGITVEYWETLNSP